MNTRNVVIHDESAEKTTAFLKRTGGVLLQSDTPYGDFYIKETEGQRPDRINQIKAQNMVEQMKRSYSVKEKLVFKHYHNKVAAFLDAPSPEALKEGAALTQKVFGTKHDSERFFLERVKDYGEKVLGKGFLEDTPPPSGGAGGGK
jgi:hypothetical protein